MAPASNPQTPTTADGGPGPKPKRTRISRACDRCRIKKAKCNGITPCRRCIEDDSICVFTDRQYSQNRVVPKGYIELLEDQQGQLIGGLRELYRRLMEHGVQEPIRTPRSDPASRAPKVHDVLDSLGLLSEKKKRGPPSAFHEDLQAAQQQLFAMESALLKESESPDGTMTGSVADLLAAYSKRTAVSMSSNTSKDLASSASSSSGQASPLMPDFNEFCLDGPTSVSSTSTELSTPADGVDTRQVMDYFADITAGPLDMYQFTTVYLPGLMLEDLEATDVNQMYCNPCATLFDESVDSCMASSSQISKEIEQKADKSRNSNFEVTVRIILGIETLVK